jgi:hypothetical protein
MPIARTVSGLIYLDELDDLDAWTKVGESSPICVHSFDTADKHSGAACSLWSIAGGSGYSGRLDKQINVGSGNARLQIWHKYTTDGAAVFRAALVHVTEYGRHDVSSPGGSEAWTIHAGLITDSGLQTVTLNYVYLLAGQGTSKSAYGRADRLSIFSALDIIVTGLTPGQKVELYRASDNALLDTETCAAPPATSITFTIANTELSPEQMYLKIYATDGATLIETTASYEVCGGDTWDWTPGAGTLKITVDADIIYRTAAVGTPKTCNVTGNLKTLAGANYPGATIYFSTTLGAASPTSDVTDANGNAETALTSASYGIAVVKAWFLGDATVPACSAYYTVHVFYEAEAPDTAKDFQFYIEGIEYAYVTGRYTQNELGDVNDFEVEIPEWLSTITINGFVNIYRKGVKEFHGILKMPNRSLSDNPRVVLKGPDVSALLNDTIADTKIYSSKTPQFIINDLLTSFVCGIYPGSLGSCTTNLTITIETESLAKAIPRVCDLVGWKFRVNMDRTLDFAESFTGGTAAASFTEGEDLTMADRQTNYSAVENYIRMKGSGIYSTKQDGTKIQEQGLHQAPAFNKSISNQATLDAACQAYLDMKKVEEETIPAEVIDEYDPGTFGPEDYITVTSATTGLSGTYQIRKIERNLKDPNYAKLDLSNKTKEYWELDTEYRRMTKDANV